MNILEVADVVDDRHACVGNGLGGGGLAFPEFGFLVGVSAVVEWRDLHEVEREFAFVPDIAPAANEALHSVGVMHALAKVGLALIPDCAAYPKTDERMNH